MMHPPIDSSIFVKLDAFTITHTNMCACVIHITAGYLWSDVWYTHSITHMWCVCYTTLQHEMCCHTCKWCDSHHNITQYCVSTHDNHVITWCNHHQIMIKSWNDSWYHWYYQSISSNIIDYWYYQSIFIDIILNINNIFIIWNI